MSAFRLFIINVFLFSGLLGAPLAKADDVLIAAEQRLNQNDNSFDLDSPIMKPIINGWSDDLCTRCQCCQIGKTSWDDLKRAQSQDILSQKLIVLPKTELNALVSQYLNRTGQNSTRQVDASSLLTREDICQRCRCCTDNTDSFDWSKLSHVDGGDMKMLQENLTIVPAPEFYNLVDKNEGGYCISWYQA
jgi:hypothetical protein